MRLTKMLEEGKREGVHQKGLAAKADVPASAISHLLKHGKGAGPALATGLAKLFGMTRGELTAEAEKWWDSKEGRDYSLLAMRTQAAERERRTREKRSADLDVDEHPSGERPIGTSDRKSA